MKYCDTCHSPYPDDFTTCPRDATPLRGTSELPSGLVLRGKYQILEKIGMGGMATVYRARHLAFGEIRAVKVVSGRLAEDGAFLRRFRAEAVVARRLQHPNAVRVDDLDTTEDGRPFIVMEYFEGRNLRELVRSTGPLAPARALRIGAQVASALGAAHELGIIHRDIKPDNVLVGRREDGSDLAKVLDFGIARVGLGFFEDGEGHVPTQTGTVLGTPQYISPEQAMGKRSDEIDGRADLYSLGVVLYEMVTGRLPFQSDTAMGMILHHLQTAPTPPDIVRPDLALPAALCDVLLRALQKDPEARFANADEMRVELERLAELPELRDARPPAPIDTEAPTRAFPAPVARTVVPRQADTHPVPAAVPVSPTPIPAPATPRRGWRRWKIAAAVLAVLLVIAVATDDERRPPEPPAPPPAAEAGAEPEDPQTLAARAEIVARVEEALGNATATEDEDIEVTADEDTIVLRGTVTDPVVRAVAEALAESVPGVDDVRNEIGVAGVAPPVPPIPEARVQVRPVPPAMGPPMRPSPGSREAERLEEALRDGEEALARRDAHGALNAFNRAMRYDVSDPRAAEGISRATTLIVEQATARGEEARRRALENERRREERRRAAPSPP